MFQKILYFVFLSLILSACGDSFLDKKPLVDRVEANFYQTQKDAEEALVAIYDVLGWNTVTGFHPLQMLTDIASDDSYAGGASRNDAPNIIEMDKHNIRTTSGEVQGLWRKYYIGIYRANIFLERIEGIDATADFKKRTMAEAKFLRAYYYFDLLRIFENVPLVTQTLKGSSEYNQPQATPKAVYNQIAKDLVEAIADLPATIPASESGRVSKWAAKSLLGRVFLYVNGVYADNLDAGTKTIDKVAALAEVEAVITSSGHTLLTNFADNFKKAYEFSVESVFEISHSDVRKWGDWGFIIGGEGNIAVQMQGARIDNPGAEIYERGWSFSTITKALYDAFEAGDARREASIIVETEYKGTLTIGYQHTGYFSKKYTTSKEYKGADGSPELNWGNNYRVIRFSDVLLMAAELGSANAQQHYDRVRNRAGLTSKPVTIANVYQERRVELAMEGVRYWDLLRRVGTVANDAISITGQRGSRYVGDNQDFDITFNAARKGFFPIPQTEMDLSGGVYKQNTGY